MPYYYIMTLNGPIPGGAYVGQNCSVTFHWPDHSFTPVGGFGGHVHALDAVNNTVTMVTNHINLMDSWNQTDSRGEAVDHGIITFGGQTASTDAKPITAKFTKFAKEKAMQPEMEAAATRYSVTITMSQDTLIHLTEGGYSLFGFKAVKTAMKEGKPLVWFQTTVFALSTEIWWIEEYQAYTSKSEIVPGGRIIANNPYEIDLGETLIVTGKDGTGYVDTKGTPLAISIYNDTNTQFSCGISQKQGDAKFAPMCSFPLYGENLLLMAPKEQVLLMFVSEEVDTGTVVETAYSAGILIDLTGDNSRDVSYEINQSWSWDGGPWAQKVKPRADLVPLLIQPSRPLVKRQQSASGG